MVVTVAEPHGMCSGVARALRIAEQALAEHPGEVLWCFHEIVHNAHVVAKLREQGVVFVDDIALIPDGGRVLFSAHGVSPRIRQEATERGLEVIDATCPFVAKVHAEARAFAEEGLPIVLVGHKQHDEVVGICGEAPGKIRVIESEADVRTLSKNFPFGTTIAVLSQTTVSQEMLEERKMNLIDAGFWLRHPKNQDICYATRERQDAVRKLARQVDKILVLGSKTSSNSKRLVEVARSVACPASLIESPEAFSPALVQGVKHLGVTSGASTPEPLLAELLQKIAEVSP